MSVSVVYFEKRPQGHKVYYSKPKREIESVLPVRRFSGVPHDVVGEVLLAGEGLAAHLATERCVVGVTANVVRQVLLACELLAAERTRVRGLACVPHHVVHKVLLARERFLTNIAAVWRVTCHSH